MEIITAISKISGYGSSLVSYYVPKGANIGDARERIQHELSTATNIKDKINRYAVIDSLKAVIDELNKYKVLPETGMAVFAGQCI